MLALRTQIALFLALALLASRILASSQCFCKCFNSDIRKTGNVCDLISKLQTSDENNINQLEQNVKSLQRFQYFLNNKDRMIADVVKKVTERNSVDKPLKNLADGKLLEISTKIENMQKIVTSLVSFQSDMKEEIRSISFTVENLKAYLHDRLKELTHNEENLTAKMKTLEATLLTFRRELENNANNNNKLSKLYGDLKNQEKVSHSITSELLLRVEKLEEKLESRENTVEIDKTLKNITSGTNGGRIEMENMQTESTCTDTLTTEYCEQMVKAKFCMFEQYASQCCESCAKSGKLSPSTNTVPQTQP